MKDIRQKLLGVFQIEHKEHVEQIRSLLAHLEPGVQAAPGAELEEAFRRAHSLKGAARAVDLRPVETLAHRLETLFSRVREGALTLDAPILRVIHQTLDSTEDVVACLNEGRGPSVEAARALEAIERVLAVESQAPAAPAPSTPPASPAPVQPIETVRISAETLDRLLRSSGQLLTESLFQNRVGQQLNQLARQIADMEKDWDRVREGAAVPLRRLAAASEFSRVGRYLDSMDRQLRSLSSEARTVRQSQQRSSRMLRHLSEQLQQEVWQARMVPAESIFGGFRKMVRDLARDQGKEVEFRATGLEVQADRMVLQALKDPLMHLLRNAVCHGIESPASRAAAGKTPAGLVTLRLEARRNRLHVAVEDDGGGVDIGAVTEVAVRKGLLSEAEARSRSAKELARLILQPGFSTSRVVTDLSGRGMGLSVVHEQVKRLQGEIDLEQEKGSGARILLVVPLSVSTHRLLLVACSGQTLAVPVHTIERLCRIRIEDVRTMEGKPVVNLQGRPIPLVMLARVLELAEASTARNGNLLATMIMRSGGSRVAVVVDAFVAQRDAVVKDLGANSDKAAGGILLEDGTVAVVLNPLELLDVSRRATGSGGFQPPAPETEQKRASILVVDDSITTRSLEKSILEAHGYEVRVAVDGVEALAQLRLQKADVVITDVQMPRMDGFVLVEEMKKDKQLAQIPVIIVTSMERREDQEKGLALGADAYVMKRKFDQRELLETIRQIV